MSLGHIRSTLGPLDNCGGPGSALWAALDIIEKPMAFICLQQSEGRPGGALEGPWGALGAPEAFGEAPRESLRGPREVGSHKVRILGRFVITWVVLGAPAGALEGAQGARTFIDTDRGTPAQGPWSPLSYQPRLIAQRKIGRSAICPSLQGSGTPLSCWPGKAKQKEYM